MCALVFKMCRLSLQTRLRSVFSRQRTTDSQDLPQLDPKVDRGMICGSMDFLKDTKRILEEAGLTEGANSNPGEFVV